jgi:hypothetical protein
VINNKTTAAMMMTIERTIISQFELCVVCRTDWMKNISLSLSVCVSQLFAVLYSDHKKTRRPVSRIDRNVHKDNSCIFICFHKQSLKRWVFYWILLRIQINFIDQITNKIATMLRIRNDSITYSFTHSISLSLTLSFNFSLSFSITIFINCFFFECIKRWVHKYSKTEMNLQKRETVLDYLQR